MERHPTTASWRLPPPERAQPLAGEPGGARVTNLRELAARPGRFEHHLMVVGEVGGAQLEIATASEPLYFAHANHSDEYALALPTGDPQIDGFPMRTFLSDPASGEDVGRIRHRVGQLVLHPLGWLHWTGRLRPPFRPFAFPEGARRCGLSLVFCAVDPAGIAPGRPATVTAGLEEEVKAYRAGAAPLATWDCAQETGLVAQTAEASLVLHADLSALHLPRGGYVVVLEAAAGSPFFATDLVHLPARAEPWELTGVTGALVASSATQEAAAPPVSWTEVPAAPWAPYEEGESEPLPFVLGDMRVEALDDERAAVTLAGGTAREVPRYWLARMLYRLPLHAYRVGYLETYGGFFYDDRDGQRLGLRDGGELRLDPATMNVELERLYRAVAPPGYVERLA